MGSFLDRPRTDKTTEAYRPNAAGTRAVVSAMQGWRVDMEDAHSIHLSISGHPAYAWFAVLDGHGGSLVSRTAAEKLLGKVLARPEWAEAGHSADGKTYNAEKVAEALRRGFLDMDDDLRNLSEVTRGDDHSGSTAVAALVTPNHIFVANCGDSRSVLVRGGSVVAMSDDHKPFLEKEQRRIEAAGGTVTMRRVNGDLAVSRALGDFVYKHMRDMKAEDQQVSAEPEIRIEPRSAEDEFLVLACDGIWDVMSNEDMSAVLTEKAARGGLDDEDALVKAAEALLDDCLEKNSRDNMSVIIVDFVSTRKAKSGGAAAPAPAHAHVPADVHTAGAAQVPEST